MKDEIAAAVVFFTKLVRKNPSLTQEHIEKFQNNLTATLLERFKDHWYETYPSRGQGYRCIRLHDCESVDPVLDEAAQKTGLRFRDLSLPGELTVWVDPAEVSCRLGENRGAFCTLALFRNGSSENRAKSVDVDEILALHHERKHAEHVKFVKATTTRTSRRKDSRGSSPPVLYPGTPPTAYTWDNGYHGNDQYYPGGYEVELEDNSQNVHWAQQQQQQQWLPHHLHNDRSRRSPSNHSTDDPGSNPGSTSNTPSKKKSRPQTHKPSKFRWVKPMAAEPPRA